MITMSAVQHQINGEIATNSYRASPSPVLTGMIEQVPAERIPTAQDNRIQTVGRRKWSRDDNRTAMECYLRSNPDIRGYRRRMIDLWKDKGMFDISEQRLADQVKHIRRNQWLTKVEIEEMKRTITRTDNPDQNNHRDQDVSVTASADPQSVEQDNISGVQDQSNRENEAVEFTEEEVGIKERIEEILSSRKRSSQEWKVSALRQVPRSKLIGTSKVVGKTLGKISTSNLTETNDLVFAGAVVVAERLGVKLSQSKHRPKDNIPWWKRRLEGQIKELRKDLSRIEQMNKGAMKDSDIRNRLMEKYRVRGKGMSVVIEEVKQRIKAKAAKVKRYDDRVKQFRQNNLFRSNQRQLFKELDGKSDDEQAAPEPDEARTFWSGLWDQPVQHNRQAEWLSDVRDELKNVQRQGDVQIDEGKVKRQLGKVPNWKAPGPDHVHGFWLKTFSSLHGRIARQLQECLVRGKIPVWLTEARTVLVMKDAKKGNIASNYRPITCLPILYKLLTGILAEELYRHVEEQDLFPEEQKGCKKRSRGTKDQLVIDKTVLKDCKRRKTNLAMAWIDYKKAYDMVPHSWIMECLDLVGAADAVKCIIGESMKTWRTNLTANNNSLGKINIRRGIFQGDSLSPLLFVIALAPLSMVLRKVSAGYKMVKDGYKINHLLFMDDVKLFGKNKKELESLVKTVRIFQ